VKGEDPPICDLLSSCVEIHEHLPKDPGSAACAREVLARLTGHVGERALADAKLLVTELVANAVQHVPDNGELSLDVVCDRGRLRVGVGDPGHGFQPQPRRPDSPKDSGWGLHFVDQLSDRWAVEVDGTSRVWFELKTAG
jgi:anti-sigma regulatory factor (Ser/Thr protein kinase)